MTFSKIESKIQIRSCKIFTLQFLKYKRKGGENIESSKSRLVALLLCLFLGPLGVHRFYAGKVGTGLLHLFTLGFLGIGTTIDLIMIICGAFKDKEGNKISKWTN